MLHTSPTRSTTRDSPYACAKLYARSCSVAQLEQAFANGEPLPRAFDRSAARAGRLDLLHTLAAHDALIFSSPLFEDAATAASLDTARWLHAQECPISEGAMRTAAARGDLPMLDFFFSIRCPWSAETTRAAEANEQWLALGWCAMQGCPLDDRPELRHRVRDAAAEAGRVDLLQWAGCLEPSTARIAVEHEQLRVLEWLHAARCPLDEYVLWPAAEEGSIFLLEWGAARGWPIEPSIAHRAAVHNQVEVLEWLRLNGHPIESYIFNAAFYHENLDVLEWMHTRGLEWELRIGFAQRHMDKARSVAWCVWRGYLLEDAVK